MLDLFSGIGGFSLAARWTGQIRTVAFCEIDPFCQKVLKKHWPTVPIYDDIKTLKGDEFGTIDILTGGFPCQPFSVAGKRRGKEDDRYLWPEMFRIIKESQPRWVLGENVAGILHMALDQALSDMESSGYEVYPFVVPACAVDSPQLRQRVFVIAYASRFGWDGGHSLQNMAAEKRRKTPTFGGKDGKQPEMASMDCGPVQGTWSHQPPSDRVVDGLPNQLDRLKVLGNAIVPQVAYEILKAIIEAEGGIA